MINLSIEARVIGQRKSAFAGWNIPLPPPEQGEHLRLRDLITRVVQTEVAAFNQRQSERPLIRFLSKTDLEQAVITGKVDMGGHETGPMAVAQTAVDIALLAFVDGLYFVFLDDVQQTDLDVELFLKPDSHLTFLRLTPLAGG